MRTARDATMLRRSSLVMRRRRRRVTASDAIAKNSKASGGEDRRGRPQLGAGPGAGDARRRPANLCRRSRGVANLQCVCARRVAVGTGAQLDRGATPGAAGGLRAELPREDPPGSRECHASESDERSTSVLPSVTRQARAAAESPGFAPHGRPWFAVSGNSFRGQESRAIRGAGPCCSSSVFEAPYEYEYRKCCALHQHVRSARQLTQRRQNVDAATLLQVVAHVRLKEAQCRFGLSHAAPMWQPGRS